MIFNVIIISISIIFSKIEAQYQENDYAVAPNCTEIYSIVTPRYVPYTEIYTTRNFLGFTNKRSRVNYKLENHTSFHERIVCCDGYRNFDLTLCLPICTNNCGRGGVCSKPEICECFEGYERDGELNKCKPVCESKCTNGNCILPNICSCNEGFQRKSYNTCEPICDNCYLFEYCFEPHICRCIDGYAGLSVSWRDSTEDSNNTRCKPVCDRECINSDCIKPNVCKCHKGYEHIDDDLFTCEPKCVHGCKNGQCSSPNNCTCFTGYKLKKDNFHICEPICTVECVNADCIAPEICSCRDGFVPLGEEETNICQPYCSNSCPHGRCSSPEKCDCEVGYELKNNGTLCEPICTENCFMGNCTSPDTCTCLENYKFKEGSKSVCELICSNECINGRCTGPEECTCDDGYEKRDDNFKCSVICECENGRCNETSSICSTCAEGYDLIYINDSTICKPHCEGNCTNGLCIAPQICHCNEYYIASDDAEGNSICINACSTECVHGNCLKESSICSCFYGWSGKYCDKPLLCSITILENEPIYLQLNESNAFVEFENITIIEKSWPICNNRCLKKINNKTKCINQLDGEFPNITCLINIGLKCNIYSQFQSDTNKAEVNVTIVVISSIITLFVLIIAIYGALFVRKSTKFSVELMGSIQEVQKHEDDSLNENENSSISL